LPWQQGSVCCKFLRHRCFARSQKFRLDQDSWLDLLQKPTYYQFCIELHSFCYHDNRGSV